MPASPLLPSHSSHNIHDTATTPPHATSSSTNYTPPDSPVPSSSFTPSNVSRSHTHKRDRSNGGIGIGLGPVSQLGPDALSVLSSDTGTTELALENGKIPISESSRTVKRASAVKAATIIPIWIAISSAVIIYNKYLYTNLEFPYPIFVTSYHLGCAALGTRVLRLTTNLMDGLDAIPMTREIYIKSILPIGVLFSGSLILSNTAYLTLSVSFIQMLKAFTPVAIIITSSIFGLQKFSPPLAGIVMLISIGCALAAYGELHFEMFGFVCQTSAVLFESSRLVMIELLLKGLKMDPLSSLHYYAPVCSIINACFLPFTEGWAPFLALARIGPFILITNAACAFALNVAGVFLIGAAGGLTLTLAGVFKDILLISSSVVFFGSTITPVQIFGYCLALVGLVAYRNVSSNNKK